jgi:uncharacterized protein YfaP (DUF2135 family)
MKQKKMLLLLVVFVGGLLILSGCSSAGAGDDDGGGGGGGSSEPVSVDPSDPEALTDALFLPDGSQVVEGTLGSSALSGETNDTSLTVSNETIEISNGGSVTISLDYTGSNAAEGVALQVVGSSRYFMIPQSSPASGTIDLPIGLASYVTGGTFSVDLVIYDADAKQSNNERLDFEVNNVGAGELQIQLNWDDNGTDLDLYVLEPDGSAIFYGNDSGTGSGGALDVDDRDGGGPENIFYETLPPDGTYRVEVDFYSGPGTYSFAQPTGYNVTIANAGQELLRESYRFRDIAEDFERHEIATITVSGGSVSIEQIRQPE